MYYQFVSYFIISLDLLTTCLFNECLLIHEILLVKLYDFKLLFDALIISIKYMLICSGFYNLRPNLKTKDGIFGKNRFDNHSTRRSNKKSFL